MKTPFGMHEQTSYILDRQRRWHMEWTNNRLLQQSYPDWEPMHCLICQPVQGLSFLRCMIFFKVLYPPSQIKNQKTLFDYNPTLNGHKI